MLLLLVTSPLWAQADEWRQDLPTDQRVPGGVAVMPLAAADAPKPALRFNDHDVLVVSRDGLWYAVVGLPLELRAGDQQVDLNGAFLLLELANKQYPSSTITVTNAATVRPSEAQQQRIARENAELMAALNPVTKRQPEVLAMQPPVAGRFTSVFGKRRYYNGQREPKIHTGLDIAAATGTPVAAPSAGSVALVANRFLTGNTVVLDHGSGMFSMYCHLDSTAVIAGDELTTGQLLGKVGATGRVTGPHLHWSVWLNGSWVEPGLFLAEQ